jgi:HEPN domain-containing protein
MNRSLEHARTLLSKAHGDAHILSQLLDDPKSPDWGLGFHGQQAVEKAIKSVLTARGTQYPFTHDVQLLLSFLLDAGITLPPDSQSLPQLTPFAAMLRYDNPVSAEAEKYLDRNWVQQVVQRTLTWAEGMI